MKIGTFLRTVLLLLSCMTVFGMTASAQVQLKHSYTFEDGTAADVIGGADGVVSGAATFSDGAYVNTSDGYVTLPGETLALNTYDAITLEAFITGSNGANTGYTMLAYFGGLTGANDFWIQPTRSSSGNSATEAGGTWLEGNARLDSDMDYHIVSVLTDTTLTFYVNGIEVVSGTGTGLVEQISTENAWIGKGGWPDAPWKGTLHELNIYNGAVDSMVIAERAESFSTVDLNHSYQFDIDASDAIGDADGTIDGGTVSGGSYVAATEDDNVILPADVIAINTYSAITVEAFINIGSETPTNSALFYLGGSTNGGAANDGGFGANGFSFAPKHWDGPNARTTITCGSEGSPWDNETVVSTTSLEAEGKHHVVATLDSVEIGLFIDGVKIGTTALPEGNKIANLSNDFAWIASGGYTSDPTWLGSIEEFNIYEGVLSDEFIVSRKDFQFRPKSEDNTLAVLAVDGGVFSAPFDPATTTYDVTVPTGTESIEVKAWANDALASVAGAGTVDVSTGSGADTITVTAENGSVNTYYVNITVDAATTLGFEAPASVSEYLNSDAKVVLPDYATEYWTGTADTLYQYPEADSAVAAGPVVLIAEMNDGSVETKFLSLNVIDASLWIGSVSSDFYDVNNWAGTQNLGKWTRVHIGPVAEGNYDCIYTANPSTKQHNVTILSGGKLYSEYSPTYADYLYMEKGSELEIRKSGLVSIRHSFDFSGATITILDDATLDQKGGMNFNFATDTLTEATLNVFGGRSQATSHVVFGKGTAHINMKNGGIAEFPADTVITDAIDSGYIMPVGKTLLVFDDAAWISSYTVDLPDARKEVLSYGDSCVLPDYIDMYALGDSTNNITITQTPAAGTVYKTAGEVVSVVISGTDYFGNELQDTMEVTIRGNANVWRGDFSENYEDSANWEGVWPIVDYAEILIDKTYESSNDPVFTSGGTTQIGELEIMPGNTLYVSGGDLRPNDPVVMYSTSELVIDNADVNIRESGAWSLNNGTVTLLSHKDGYSWSEFDHKAAVTFASGADDEFTLNAWGGEAWLGNTSFGDGTVHLNFKDGGAASFNDSAMIAGAFDAGIIEANENVILRKKTDNSYVVGATAIAPENQIGLVDGEGKYEVPDYTGLVTFSFDGENTITVEQTPAAGTIIDVLDLYDVIFTASDEWGNVSVDTCELDVIDYTVYCPEVSTITDAYALDSVPVPDFTGDAETVGNWVGTVTVTQIPAIGTLMPIDSVFDVTITAADEADNLAECAFTITVIDTTKPVITVIEDQIVATDEYCIATIPDYSEIAVVTDTCVAEYTFTQTPAAGTQMANLGDESTITLTVADGYGNTSEPITFKATAKDITAPLITKGMPDVIPVSAASGCSYPIPDFAKYFEATDYCTAELTVTQSPEAGGTIEGDGTELDITISFDDNNGNVADSTITLKLSCPNAIANAEVGATLSVYPSPATSSITIDANGLADDAVVSIIDLSGDVKAVVTELSTAVSVSDLEPGVYIVKAVSSNGVAITKFVKE